MPCSLSLPPKADVMRVVALREEWIASIGQEHQVEVQCAGVETMTAAAAQLLLCLNKSLSAAGGSLSLMAASDTLRADLTLLGLATFCKESPHG